MAQQPGVAVAHDFRDFLAPSTVPGSLLLVFLTVEGEHHAAHLHGMALVMVGRLRFTQRFATEQAQWIAFEYLVKHAAHLCRGRLHMSYDE